MKRCLVLFGAEGKRVAEAIAYAACAGVLSVPEMDMLLVDVGEGSSRAETLCGQYMQMRAWMGSGDTAPFRTGLTFRTWPEHLPEGNVSLQAWAGEREADGMLCRALFSREAANADARDGLGGHADAAAAFWAGLLAGEPQGALASLMEEAERELDNGEDVRVALCGAVEDAMSAAGIPALARYLQERWEKWDSRTALAAIVVLPREQDEADLASAKAALAHSGLAGMKIALYPLGVPVSGLAIPRGEEDAAHLTQWLAVRCADSFLGAENPPEGVTVYRAAAGRLGWESFGEDAERYRLGYGRLIKTAALFRMTLTPVIRRGVTAPQWLRDRLIGWYAAYFGAVRRMTEEQRADVIRTLDTASALLDGSLTWMEEVLSTLPPALRSAGAVEQARQAAETHYRQVIEMTAQLSVLEQEALQSGMAEEKAVHRHDMADTEAERMQRTIAAMGDNLRRLRERQEELNHQMGGAAYLAMLSKTRASLEAESADLHAQAEEAARRIEAAALVAAPEEQHRVANARTKLRRLERHIALVDARLESVRLEEEEADAPALKMQLPQAARDDALPESGLFRPDALTRFSRLTRQETESQNKRDMAALEEAWAGLVVGEESGPTVQRVLTEISAQRPDKDAPPVARLMMDVLARVMKEGQA